MLAPSIREQWYLTYSPFQSKVDIALCQRTVVPNSSPFLSKAREIERASPSTGGIGQLKVPPGGLVP
jgi:hypothetical protein